jgi:signal transduction histidine kinase/ligand-binding sensor domain-containing protein
LSFGEISANSTTEQCLNAPFDQEANTVIRLVFSLLLCWSCQVFAVAWQRLALDDALPNVGVYSLVQDQTGFIWFGSTNVGIIRYDGVAFRPYELSSVNPIGEVPDIDKLVFDEQGHLWAASWGYGLLQIDLGSGQVQSFASGDAQDQLYSPFVQTLLNDSQNRMWVGTNGGVNLFEPGKGLRKMFHTAASKDVQPLIHPRVWALAETADHKIWIATSRGLQYYTEQQGLSPVIEPHGVGSNDNEIRALQADGRWLWVGTRAGLFRLDSQTLQIQAMPYYTGTSYPIINALAKDLHGHLLIGSFDGISQFIPETMKLEPIEAGGNALKGVNIRSLLVDRTGLVWAGTRERGIYKGRVFDGEFNAWSAGDEFKALRDVAEPVLSLYKDGQGLWLGRANSIQWQTTGSTQLQQFITNARVNAFARSADTLWVGTDTGLLRYHQTQGFISDNSALEPLKLAARNVRDLLFTADGRMILGLWSDGVVIVSPQGPTQLLADISRKTTGDAVQDLEIIGDELFIATRLTGVYRYHLKTGAFVHLNALVPTLTTKATCLGRGPKNSLLICATHGLQQLQLLTQQLQSYSRAQNLASEDLMGVYTDEFDRIWALSSEGLSVLPQDSDRFINYGEAEGLSSRDMMFKAIAGEPGAVYVGTAKGIDRIGSVKIWQNRIAPQVILSQVQVDHQPIAANWQGHCCQQVVLQPGQSALALQFATLDYNDSALNHVEVQLLGYDNDWQRVSSDGIKHYTNLAPGDYQLHFRGSNHHGVMSAETTIAVEIKPEWLQRRSVQVLLLLSLLGSIVAFYLYRLKNLHRINQLLHDSVQAKAINEQQLEQKVVERTTQLRGVLSDLAESNVRLKQLDGLKDDFISTVSHELRTPLTSIHGAIRLLNSPQLRQQPEVAAQLLLTAEENSNRLLVLVNDLLDLQKFESGAMQLNWEATELSGLIRTALQGLQTYADRFQVSICTTSEIPALSLELDPLRIRQVLDNLLSNAIKFSKAMGTVELSVVPFADRVQVMIKDSGEGIPLEVQKRLFSKFVQADSSSNKSRYGSGLGLVICKRIVELHGGDIGFQSALGQGSSFWFSLPLHAHHASEKLSSLTEPQVRSWPTATVEPTPGAH